MVTLIAQQALNDMVMHNKKAANLYMYHTTTFQGAHKIEMAPQINMTN